tara:strand:+ start:156 stop:401 length:246 start_codon:yes stop_codon:yes gene_type:complete
MAELKAGDRYIHWEHGKMEIADISENNEVTLIGVKRIEIVLVRHVDFLNQMVKCKTGERFSWAIITIGLVALVTIMLNIKV